MYDVPATGSAAQPPGERIATNACMAGCAKVVRIAASMPGLVGLKAAITPIASANAMPTASCSTK